MPDIQGVVLLIDLSADFCEALESSINSYGKRAVSLSTQDLISSCISIECSAGCGTIRLPNGYEVSLDCVCGSIASPAYLESSGADPDELEFIYSEAVGLLAYLRERAKPALNPPFAGSHVTNCGSLLEQWERVKQSNIDGVCVPEWTLQPLGNTKSDQVEIADPFDLPIRLTSDDAAQGRMRIAASRPRGAIASCAFYKETLHLLVLKDGKLCEVPILNRTASRLRAIIYMFEQSCGLDFGQIHFSYLSDLVFWSIMPSISDDHIQSPGFRPLLEKIAGSLT